MGGGNLQRGAAQALRGVLRDILHARKDDFWSRVLGVLRPGDVVSVAHDGLAPSRAALQVMANGARTASLTLPKRPAERTSAA